MARSRFTVTGALLLVASIGVLLPSKAASVCFLPHCESKDRRCWTFETGVSFITSNSIDDLVRGEVNIADDAAGGEIYTFTGSRRLGELRLEVFGRTYHPQLEVPLTLSIVDENSRGAFLDYSASFTFRWVDFPWNEWLATSISMGVGLSYSDKIFLMDARRHIGDDRSNLKFNWPIQLTFALPEFPEHEMMLYLFHHSGGRIFDRGGFNALGIGYRRDF